MNYKVQNAGTGCRLCSEAWLVAEGTWLNGNPMEVAAVC